MTNINPTKTPTVEEVISALNDMFFECDDKLPTAPLLAKYAVRLNQIYARRFLEMIDKADAKNYHFPNTAVPSANSLVGWKLDELREAIKKELL